MAIPAHTSGSQVTLSATLPNFLPQYSGSDPTIFLWQENWNGWYTTFQTAYNTQLQQLVQQVTNLNNVVTDLINNIEALQTQVNKLTPPAS